MKRKGISLIVLIITIVVIIILAVAVILAFTQNNIIDRANEATFKANVDAYQSELMLYISTKYTTSNGNFNLASLNVSSSDIKTVISNIKEEDKNDFEIRAGKLLYIGTDELKKEWFQAFNTTSNKIYINLKITWDSNVYDCVITTEKGMTWGEWLNTQYRVDNEVFLNSVLSQVGGPFEWSHAVEPEYSSAIVLTNGGAYIFNENNLIFDDTVMTEGNLDFRYYS